MSYVHLCLLAALPLVAASLAAGEGDPLGLYNVVWDSPSKDHGGSMPLGNGDVGLNAWVEAGGDLQFLISKADAWDDNARLVKVGKVRIRLEPNPFEDARSFRQTLSLRDATLRVQVGEGAAKAALQVWVDANHPVAHVAVESASPVEATASIELWRTERKEYKALECSDIMTGAPADRRQPTIIEPDTLLTGQKGRIGWYHHNAKSFGPKLLAEIQGLTGFKQEDPLLRRTFGAVITAATGERVDDRRLRSPKGTAHQFSIFVLTRHPSAPQEWLAEMDRTIARVEAESFAARRAAHERWWTEFWGRSWIRAWMAEGVEAASASPVPANAHCVRIGSDQKGGNRYAGELGRASVFGKALSDAEVQALAKLGRQAPVEKRSELLFSGTALGPVADSAAWSFKDGLTIEVWAKPEKFAGGGARLVDKITIGGSDGFLLDSCPGNSLRFICGQTQLTQRDALPAGQWTHVAAVAEPGGGCRLYVDGKPVGGDAAAAVHDEAAYVSQMYHLQRFISACGGRGRHPIKFNGSIFTVPLPDGKSDPDYRRWGPGYWWQNTRLSYVSMPASGDYDLMQPLYRMYVDDLLALCKFRTRLYCGHDGAYYPECIYFWGPMFSETYGWQPWDQRADKLQASRWHKWEWVGGLELCWLLLDHYEHTLDRELLNKTLLPLAHEILTFFDQHYKTNDQGKLVMHPAQALETWWECTNPM
ncbi:MAG: LamG domain-containing protein, partial [Planctomycetes bacterium]|nr:LamG domain-containing protein [Planctomycetota bacterium]